MSFQILPRVGVAFRYSGHGKNGREANGRANHDRSFDAHLNLLEESAYLPSLALGLRDFIGTGCILQNTSSAQRLLEILLSLVLGLVVLLAEIDLKIHFLYFPISLNREANDFGRGGTLGTINWFRGMRTLWGHDLSTMMISLCCRIHLGSWGRIQLSQCHHGMWVRNTT